MATRAITSGGDWTFGKGKADYVSSSKEIRQNVVTRLRSFKNDWFLDVEDGIDWVTLLGSRNNENRILREVERVTLQTQGVVSIDALSIISRDSNRGVTIELKFTDVFNQVFNGEVTI
jgi:hypothetical protein